MRKIQAIAGDKRACEIPHNVRRRLPKLLGVLGVFAVVAAVGPSPAQAQLPKTNRAPYAAPADQALVVFARPRHRQAETTPFRIVDRAGKCIAYLENGWHVATPLWPGKHMLMVVTGTLQPTVQLFEAKLTGGKTYIVKLRARVNMKSPVEIEVIRRADQQMEAFPPWVSKQLPLRQELRECTEWVSWKRRKLEPKAEVAKQKWDDASDEHRDERTIRRNDGWTADEIPEL